MNATRFKDTESEGEVEAVLICPICNQEVKFTVPPGELEKARISSGIIKKAINHGNKHVIVAHVDAEGVVKRMYGYECTRIGPEAETASKSSKRKCRIVTLTDSLEDSLIDDPDNFLESLLRDMERLSMEKL